jgi:hypothetical protein
VLVCKVENGLLAKLLLCDVKHKGVAFYGLLLGNRDPVCNRGSASEAYTEVAEKLTIRTKRVVGEGDHRPCGNEFLDAGLVGFPEDMKGSFNCAL